MFPKRLGPRLLVACRWRELHPEAIQLTSCCLRFALVAVIWHRLEREPGEQWVLNIKTWSGTGQ